MHRSRSNTASNPSDGIALDEKFSYEIKVIGNYLKVSVLRPGVDAVTQYVDMTGSGYDAAAQYQYFKAGVYHVNNTADVDDYVPATFYQLDNSHNGYAY